MISWLLVAVLLFAGTAITTPTSASTSSSASILSPSETSTRTPLAGLVTETSPTRSSSEPNSDEPIIEHSKQQHELINIPAQPDSEQAALEAEPTTSQVGGSIQNSNFKLAPGSATRGAAARLQDKSSNNEDILAQEIKTAAGPKKIYTNQFVIKVAGGELEARRLAEKHGFIYLNHIIGDYHHLEHRRLAKRSLDSYDMLNLDTSIRDEPHVLTFERQVLKRRVKRDFIEQTPPPSPNRGGHSSQQQQQQQQPQRAQMLRPAARPSQFLRPPNQMPANQLAFAHYHHRQPQPQLGPDERGGRLLSQLDQLDMNSSGPMPFFLQASFANGSVSPSDQNHHKHRPPPPPLISIANQTSPAAPFGHPNETALRSQAPFNDPSWPLMWYLDGGARNGFDLNVQAAWKMGYTGRGIVITILDDGLEKDHPDLQANYDPLASFDINGDDADPMPRYDSSDSNRHGTRCAGEVAAVPNNNICSVGIAYNSKVGGVRMLDGEVTDAVEARSLSLNNQHIHIYSASWGPDDNGKTVDGPGELATRAFIEGVTYGRGGRGSIFVFASGNGGRENDNCNCDGYTNSIWTLSISSASENGGVPWYIENCSSTLATTYSSGSFDERQIATTDIRHSCTRNHTGTSASAPIAAGICALVLEANPELTWRDMQHIVVRTAKPANLMARDWRTNAMGRNVSHAFGYGLMDAAAMIHMARRWRKMPDQYSCKVESPKMEKFIPSKGYIELKLRVECAKVRFIEHVQSLITLTATRRGDLHIYLTSPHGTRSTLLAQRPMDVAEQGFRNWPFMTVHNWGESPNGIWTLEVHNDGKPQSRAVLKEWNLTLYGTFDDPNRHLDASPAPHSTTSTTTTTTTSSTSTTPPPPSREASREQSSRQQLSQSPPPPSFSPIEPDSLTPGGASRPPPNRRPPPPNSQQHHAPPPPPISNQLHPAGASVPVPLSPTGGVSPPTTPYSSNSSSDASEAPSSAGNQNRAKVDFDIVAPPDGHYSKQQTSFNGRPHAHVIDSNKIDTSRPDPVETSTVGSASASSTTTSKPAEIQHDFDSNQLDAKQTKDYRSSGQHDVSTSTTTTTSSYEDELIRGQNELQQAAKPDQVLAKNRQNVVVTHSAASQTGKLVVSLGVCFWLACLQLLPLSLQLLQAHRIRAGNV